MKFIEDNSIHSCISDFPYFIEFMGKNWDSAKNWHTGEGSHSEFKGTGFDGKRRPDFYTATTEDKLIFYDWCYERAVELYRIMRSGGYVMIFGHPKTNHRMKCAFEDAGFDIVEEIDWIYFTGFPKNQDIGKLFDKREGKKREVLKTIDKLQSFGYKGNRCYGGDIDRGGKMDITTPSSDLAKQWDGWKTAGLKPAKEPITVFQKPLEGTYCDNIEKWGCGGMNIDACRIPVNPEIDDMLKETIRQKRITETWEDGSGFKNENNPFTGVRPEGRFPPNIIFDEETRKLLDEQSGIKQSKRSMRGIGYSYSQVYGTGDKDFDTERGYNDIGGGSRFFYCAKPSPKEKILVDGSKNPHITVKPISLYKWLIKLVTPKDGTTIDITAGSCTHGIACEELNRDEGYKLKWMNIELLNTEKEPYCNFAKKRIQDIVGEM